MQLICFPPLITMSYNHVLYYHHYHTVSYQYALNTLVVKYTRSEAFHQANETSHLMYINANNDQIDTQSECTCTLLTPSGSIIIVNNVIFYSLEHTEDSIYVTDPNSH